MRKVFSFILFFIFLVVLSASALHLHYCQGQWMTSISMIPNRGDGNQCRSCNKMDLRKDCCKHPKILVKINPNQAVTEVFVFKKPTSWNSIFHFPDYIVKIFQERSGLGVSIHPPPVIGLTDRRPAFLEVFLI